MSEVDVRLVEDTLLAGGAGVDTGIHSWRCSYPDRYGTCACVHELAVDVVAALHAGAPLDFTERRQHSAERQLTLDLSKAPALTD